MKITFEKFKEAIENSGGIKLVISKKLGVSRMGLDKWLKKHPEAINLIENEAESLIDKAEFNLVVALNNREQWATNKILETKGRYRGWSSNPAIVNSITKNQSNYSFRIIHTDSEGKVLKNVTTGYLPADNQNIDPNYELEIITPETQINEEVEKLMKDDN